MLSEASSGGRKSIFFRWGSANLGHRSKFLNAKNQFGISSSSQSPLSRNRWGEASSQRRDGSSSILGIPILELSPFNSLDLYPHKPPKCRPAEIRADLRLYPTPALPIPRFPPPPPSKLSSNQESEWEAGLVLLTMASGIEIWILRIPLSRESSAEPMV